MDILQAVVVVCIVVDTQGTNMQYPLVHLCQISGSSSKNPREELRRIILGPSR